MCTTELRLYVEGGGNIAPCRAPAWIRVQRSGIDPPRLLYSFDSQLPPAPGCTIQKTHVGAHDEGQAAAVVQNVPRELFSRKAPRKKGLQVPCRMLVPQLLL